MKLKAAAGVDRKQGRKPRLPLRELAGRDPCEISLPIVFLILARRATTEVRAFPHRDDASKWCFRLGRRLTFEIDAKGRIDWVEGPAAGRRDVEGLMAFAREQHAGLPPAALQVSQGDDH